MWERGNIQRPRAKFSGYAGLFAASFYAWPPEAPAPVAVCPQATNAAMLAQRQTDSAIVCRIEYPGTDLLPALDHGLLWQSPSVHMAGGDYGKPWREFFDQCPGGRGRTAVVRNHYNIGGWRELPLHQLTLSSGFDVASQQQAVFIHGNSKHAGRIVALLL